MKFISNRLELLEMSRKAMKLSDANSPVEMLRGIYLESDENTGEVSMITTNFEAAIFQKEKAVVSRSGKLVINAKLLTGMLTLLSGDKVEFYDAGKNIIRVSSDSCVYNVHSLPGEHYPKPLMPFPEEAVKVSGICSLAKKTVFAASNEKNNPTLQCVCLKINDNSAYAAACDKTRMMLAKGDMKSSGSSEFMLPAYSFNILASISEDDDIFEVGSVGNETVFMKKNLLFSIKRHNGKYIDTNQIVQSIKPKYTAVANAGAISKALDLISIAAGTMPLNIRFGGNSLWVMYEGETGASSYEIQAKLTGDMPKAGFFYKTDYLKKLFKVLDGTVKLDIDDKGMLLIKTKTEVYFQLPMKKPAITSEKKNKTDAA